MKRVLLAGLLEVVTVALLWVALVVAVFYAPRQLLIDYLMDLTGAGTDQRVIEGLLDELRVLLLQIVTAASAVVLVASLVWLVRSAFARIDVPGQVYGYRLTWATILALSGMLAAALVGYFCFSGDYLDIVRQDSRWIVTAVSLPVCWFTYWLVTAMWTPSLQAPAVFLSGAFRWMRRPFFL